MPAALSLSLTPPHLTTHSDYPEGLVTTVDRQDIARVRAALASDLPPLRHSGLYPEPEQIERLAASLPGALFEEVGQARCERRACNSKQTLVRR